MSNKLKSFMLLIVMILLAMPLSAHAAKKTIKQLQFGKQEIEVGVDDEITFCDHGERKSNGVFQNSHSLTVFKPAAGKSIEIKFSEIDLCSDPDDPDDYFTYMNVYAGNPDAGGTFKWATKIEEVTTDLKLPEGTVLKKFDGVFKNEEFCSKNPGEALSVGFIFRDACYGKGWTATVRCVDKGNTTVPEAIALIGKDNKVVEVGDVPVNFYDDGGKDGKISQDFEGSITFVPATQGKSIAIDFKKLKLFISSLGVDNEKSDVLKSQSR